METHQHRPFIITVLAVLASIAFIVNAFITLLYLGAIPAALFGGTGFFGAALLGAILWGALALIWAWVAIGLWTLNPSSWFFVVALTILNIIFSFLAVLGSTSFEAVLPTIIINAAILIYSLSPGVKEAFGLPSQPPNQPTA
ncbi:MAG TPA: hypothetical protein VFZ25_04880 [Chloroflexota bacterium]|nr:hypothetical protein [Chloroflexota bacterium]